jgi:hypothetical protein
LNISIALIILNYLVNLTLLSSFPVRSFTYHPRRNY